MEPYRLLLIDDNNSFLDLTRNFFRRFEDFDVVGVTQSADRALEIAQELDPDLIMLDIQFPETNGLEILPSLRRTLPNTSIIMLTMYNLDAYREAAREAGADAYVLKKNMATDLLPAIRQAMRSRHQLKDAHHS